MISTRTILIVDDEPRTRKGLQTTLEGWSGGKAEILTAEDGDEALAVLEQRQVHLLLTDIRMPEMSGLQLIRTLREQGSQAVVIILSGYSEFEYAQEAIRLGVVNYLLKPVTKPKLVEAVEQALEIEQKQQRVGLIEKVMDSRLMEMKQDDNQTPPPVKEAMRLIETDLKNPISLREVADHVHLNASYFSALFKEKTSLTFSEYVARSRMQAAKNLLITTDMPISAIAEEVGYQTAKYFISLFKEYEGKTPSQYRKEMKTHNTI